MESIWLLSTTFGPVVPVVLAFVVLFCVGALILYVLLCVHARIEVHRGYRREERLYKAAVREIQGRERRALERQKFFRNVQELLNDVK